MSFPRHARPRALYLHIPFCKARCAYCDFSSNAIYGAPTTPAEYARGLEALLDGAGEVGLLEQCQSAYIGGGTPTVLGEDLPRLIAEVRACAGPFEELTFEANPESASPELLAQCLHAGATRVSIGVQSLDDAVLKALGRVHSASQARSAVAQASALGYRVSVDLIAGLPGEGRGALARHALELVERGASHVSLYPLEVHGETPLGRAVRTGHIALPSEDAVADELEAAAEALEARGLLRYEIASFARPGEESRHNLRYWDGSAYLGLGTSAASMLSREAYERLRELAPSLPEAPEGTCRLRLTCTSPAEEIARARSLDGLAFEVEGLSFASAIAEDLMLAVRCVRGIPERLDRRAKEVLGAKYERTCARLCELGLLEPSAEPSYVLRPCPRAWLLSNELFGEFWALSPDEPVLLA